MAKRMKDEIAKINRQTEMLKELREELEKEQGDSEMNVVETAEFLAKMFTTEKTSESEMVTYIAGNITRLVAKEREECAQLVESLKYNAAPENEPQRMEPTFPGIAKLIRERQ
jgi:hypothetical protein